MQPFKAINFIFKGKMIPSENQIDIDFHSTCLPGSFILSFDDFKLLRRIIQTFIQVLGENQKGKKGKRA